MFGLRVLHQVSQQLGHAVLITAFPDQLLLLSPLLSAAAGVITEACRGWVRVRSGQAPAWPLTSDRRQSRGSGVKGGRRSFPEETRSALDGGGEPPHAQRAIPGFEPYQDSASDLSLCQAWIPLLLYLGCCVPQRTACACQ